MAHSESATSSPDDNQKNRVRNDDKRAYVCDIDANGKEVPETEVRAAYPDTIASVPSRASGGAPQDKGKRRDPYCLNYE